MAAFDHRHLNLLDGLPLLPCGGPTGKQPINGDGSLMTKWQNASFSVEQILQLNGNVSAVGTRTGPDADHLLILDIDGRSAVDICKKFDCAPKDTGWAIRRDTDPERLKVAFHIPEDLRPFLTRKDGSPLGKRVLQTKAAVYDVDEFGEPKRDEKNRPITLEKQEAVELFYGSGQCVVLGEHKQSGGQYFWNGDPTKLDTPNVQWWGLINHIVDSHAVEDKERQPIENGTTEQSGPLTPCVICGRNTSTACTTFNDGTRQRINCYQGQTFSPPADLKVGVDLIERDGISYALAGYGFNPVLGGFATFVEHIEKPATNQLADSDDLDDLPLADRITNGVQELLTAHLSNNASDIDAAFAQLYKLGVSRDRAQERILMLWAEQHGLDISTGSKPQSQLKGRVLGKSKEGAGLKQQLPGFCIDKDLHLLVSDAGGGKTTAMCELVTVMTARDKGFLDHEAPRTDALDDPRTTALVIASDGESSAYSMWEDYLNTINGLDRGANVEIWAQDDDTGEAAWNVSLHNLERLIKRLEQEDVAIVVMDTANAILRGAGINVGTGPIETYLRLLKQIVCRHCSLWISQHTNRNGGTSMKAIGGHPAFQEVPSGIHLIEVKEQADGEKMRVWHVLKLRGANYRRFSYQLANAELVVTDGHFYQNCREQVLVTLQKQILVGGFTSPSDLIRLTGRPPQSVYSALNELRSQRLIRQKGRGYRLTAKGKSFHESLDVAFTETPDWAA